MVALLQVMYYPQILYQILTSLWPPLPDIICPVVTYLILLVSVVTIMTPVEKLLKGNNTPRPPVLYNYYCTVIIMEKPSAYRNY